MHRDPRRAGPAESKSGALTDYATREFEKMASQPGFEPELPDRKSDVLSHYTTGTERIPMAGFAPATSCF